MASKLAESGANHKSFMRARNTYIGKPCARHPELLGERFPANRTCVECARVALQKLARSRGVEQRHKANPIIAKERRRQRDRARHAKRRGEPAYAAKRVERKRAWIAANRERHRATSRAYDARQMRENLQRRISKNLRHRVYKAMIGKTRGVSAVRDLGISIPEFRAYIASRFVDGMAWENYGQWHLDHVTPLALFDLTDTDQARKAFHYRNYQPLWALDNQQKYCKPHTARWATSWKRAEEALA